jgi:hypothetical protein
VLPSYHFTHGAYFACTPQKPAFVSCSAPPLMSPPTHPQAGEPWRRIYVPGSAWSFWIFPRTGWFCPVLQACYEFGLARSALRNSWSCKALPGTAGVGVLFRGKKHKLKPSFSKLLHQRDFHQPLISLMSYFSISFEFRREGKGYVYKHPKFLTPLCLKREGWVIFSNDTRMANIYCSLQHTWHFSSLAMKTLQNPS